MTLTPPLDLDITDGRQYLAGIPHEKFAAIRAMDGIYWHPYGDDGFWAVTRIDDVREVSTHPDTFSSGLRHTNLWDLDGEALEARRSIIDSDTPDHTRLRRIVSKAFTPKSLRQWEEATRRIAVDVLDDFQAAGSGDLVDLVAAPLPIRVILTILGVPLEDADHMVELSNYLIEGTGDEVSLPPDAFGNTTPLELLPFGTPASHALFTYADEIAKQRGAAPKDDLVSLLVAARDHQDRLSPQEYRNFFHVLILGGNETTRTAISHGAMALAANPDEWDRLIADRSLVDSAVEEILRWSTPLMYMRRTAAHDTRLSGTQISAGDKVVMWYSSANRDESAFSDPFRFDVGRDPNDHVSFGGGGPHFCLGAFLARMELRILLEEMLERGVRFVQHAEPVRAPSNFVHGVLSVEMGLAGARS